MKLDTDQLGPTKTDPSRSLVLSQHANSFNRLSRLRSLSAPDDLFPAQAGVSLSRSLDARCLDCDGEGEGARRAEVWRR
jgi:hypothetical protein